MKRFQFSLEKLLHYKEQLFDVERRVLGEMRQVLATLTEELQDLMRQYKECSEEFNQKAMAGTTVIEMQTYKSYLRSLEIAIEQKNNQIRLQQQAVDKQTDKVREAKVEVSTIEKLREKKLEEYTYQANKAQELFIEEFVSNARATANAV